MKARLYRGPMDGKTLTLAKQEQVILVDQLADELQPYDWSGVAANHPITPNVVRLQYRRTQHTHPDGSVFYEWDQPRGTKSGVRPKRRKRFARGGVISPNYITTTPGGLSTTSTTLTFYQAP